jgi:hypothetical protein
MRNCYLYKVKVKVKVQYNDPCTHQDRLWGFQDFQSLMLQANLHVNVASSSELNTSCFYSRRNISSNHSFRVSADHRDIVRPEGLRQSQLPTAPSGIQTTSFLLVMQWVYWRSYWVINCKPEKIFLVFCGTKYTLPCSQWPAIAICVTVHIYRSYPTK